MEAEGLENAHIYRPSKKARTFFAVMDDYYRDWLASLPDLDAVDKGNRRAADKLHFWES
jgi:hypothetical protein